MGFLYHFLVILRGSDDDAGGVEVVIEGMAFPEEFGAEEDVAGVVFSADGFGVAYRDGGFDDDGGFPVDLEDFFDDGFYGGGVEVVFYGVVVGGGGDDDEVGFLVGFSGIGGGC